MRGLQKRADSDRIDLMQYDMALLVHERSIAYDGSAAACPRILMMKCFISVEHRLSASRTNTVRQQSYLLLVIVRKVAFRVEIDDTFQRDILGELLEHFPYLLSGLPLGVDGLETLNVLSKRLQSLFRQVRSAELLCDQKIVDP